MKEIHINISTTGEVNVKTKGFAGSACKKETADFEKLLGKVTSDKPTEEAYRHEEHHVVNRQ
jgi:hypothetical protein